jgi:hypothetical protein
MPTGLPRSMQSPVDVFDFLMAFVEARDMGGE